MKINKKDKEAYENTSIEISSKAGQLLPNISIAGTAPGVIFKFVEIFSLLYCKDIFDKDDIKILFKVTLETIDDERAMNSLKELLNLASKSKTNSYKSLDQLEETLKRLRKELE